MQSLSLGKRIYKTRNGVRASHDTHQHGEFETKIPIAIVPVCPGA